ncbi:AAA family ATPase [Paenibacillus alginolyticus]|uniref:AAA family ATPase n=1 Tax=Paenibacillus alginolyticus TaxID=59839 RepID=A0ABT4GKN0_9BACL|nr:AAA family ATPase [Paenibacillus alginolyticus]MCY9696749.1 AAA family ATPase [Paenibacillus alginolyticus]MEC0147598.1 AAA family ATPase [Paenibacillus alginolyticus]
MIIMINGAFGAGKTTAANELLPFVPNSMIFDPEEIGYMLRKLVTVEDRLVHERTDDFQDLEMWRVLTVKTAAELKSTYNKHLIVPMTIYKRHNFDYIYNGFKRIDKNVFHFCLSATADTLNRRLTKRGDEPGGWQFQQVDKCVAALKDPVFENHISTDDLETEDILRIILKKIS